MVTSPVSPTKIAKRRACPLAFAWRHVDRREPTDPHDDDDGLAVGKAVHGALAQAITQAESTDVEPTWADHAVRRRGLAPDLTAEAVAQARSALRLLQALAPRRQAWVEQEAGLELLAGSDHPFGTTIHVDAYADLVLPPTGGAAPEVWDWKTQAAYPPDTETLMRDPQVLTYLSWARGRWTDSPPPVARWAYLAHERVVTVRWTEGMEAYLTTLVRQHQRGASQAAKRAPARPGRNCARCEYRSGCQPLEEWLARGTRLPDDSDDVGSLARAYREASARAKLEDQRRKEAGERLLVVLGDRRRFEVDGLRITRVRGREQSAWPAEAVSALARATGADESELWREVGAVSGRAFADQLDGLPPADRERIEGLAERTRTAEHVRVVEE